jgi:DNA-binding transcriptional ArsR family regulator
VAVIEALRYVGDELSANEIAKLFDDAEYSLSNISYHLNALAGKGILVVTRERQVRGAVETFYFFPEAGEGI